MQQLSPPHNGADGEDDTHGGQGPSQPVLQGVPCVQHAADPPALHVYGEQHVPAPAPDDAGSDVNSSDEEGDQHLGFRVQGFGPWAQ